jgi:hypothetical protein
MRINNSLTACHLPTVRLSGEGEGVALLHIDIGEETKALVQTDVAVERADGPAPVIDLFGGQRLPSHRRSNKVFNISSFL